MPRKSDLPFSERVRFDSKTGELVEESSLRARFPDYLKAFGLGLAVTGSLGVIIGLLSSMSVENAVGYVWIFSGTFLLLVGGARGGGYTNLSIGAMEAVVGGRNRSDDDFEGDAELRQGRVMKRRDPMARLRRGLRPPPNPTAFWQTIAGFLLIGLGLPFTF